MMYFVDITEEMVKFSSPVVSCRDNYESLSREIPGPLIDNLRANIRQPVVKYRAMSHEWSSRRCLLSRTTRSMPRFRRDACRDKWQERRLVARNFSLLLEFPRCMPILARSNVERLLPRVPRHAVLQGESLSQAGFICSPSSSPSLV